MPLLWLIFICLYKSSNYDIFIAKLNYLIQRIVNGADEKVIALFTILALSACSKPVPTDKYSYNEYSV